MEVRMDPVTHAFYKGAAKAQEVTKEVAPMLRPDTTFDNMLAQFWLLIGMQAQQYETQEEVDGFLKGVFTNAPQRTGVLVEFSTTSAEFHRFDADEDWESAERDYRKHVSRVLMRVSSEVIGGADEGRIFNGENVVIGCYATGLHD